MNDPWRIHKNLETPSTKCWFNWSVFQLHRHNLVCMYKPINVLFPKIEFFHYKIAIRSFISDIVKKVHINKSV